MSAAILAFVYTLRRQAEKTKSTIQSKINLKICVAISIRRNDYELDGTICASASFKFPPKKKIMFHQFNFLQEKAKLSA